MRGQANRAIVFPEVDADSRSIVWMLEVVNVLLPMFESAFAPVSRMKADVLRIPIPFSGVGTSCEA